MGRADRAAIGGLCTLAIAMGVGRFAYTPLLPWMQADGAFGPQGAGLLASINLAGYLAGAVGASVAGGRSRLAILRGSLLLSILTSAAMGIADTFTAWAILRFVAGIVSAGALIAASDLVIGAARAAGRPAIIGWHFAGVGTGIAVSGLVVAVVAPVFGWRGGWLALGGLSLALLPLCWAWLAVSGSNGTAAPAGDPTPARYPVVALLLAYFCEGAGYIITGTFLVALTRELPGLAAAGEYFWIVVGLAAAPSTMLWHAIGRRIGAVPALVAAHLLQALGVVLPVLFANAWGAFASALLFGGTFMGITALALSFGGVIAGRHRARIIGALTAAYGVGQALGPGFGGLLAERSGSFDAALLAAALIIGAGAAFLLLGRAYRPASSRA